MAKLTYLALVNRVLRRITVDDLAQISDASGRSQLVVDFINEAQNAIFTEPVNWYSLYQTRVFTTVVTSEHTTIAFNDADPDTITDSGNGFVTDGYLAGMEIHVSGSTSNDGTYTIATVAAGTLTLQTADKLTAETAGETITITAYTHPVAVDFGRCLDLTNITDNRLLIEDYERIMDARDADMNSLSSIESFTVQNDNYRFFPIPNGATKIRDRYWKIPTTLSADGDTSDLPIECENCLIYWAWSEMLDYLNNFERADRARIEYARLLANANKANAKRLNQQRVMRNRSFNRSGFHPVLFPDQYGSFSRGFF